MTSTVAYLDSKANTLDVVPPRKAGKPERTFRNITTEQAARRALRSAGYTVTSTEPYPYGTALTVTR